MTAATAAKSVNDALAEVDRWKSDEESRHKAELVEVEQEITNLENAIDNLKQQHEALLKFRDELDKKAQALPMREIERAHKALFSALAGQSGLLAEREQVVSRAVSARRDGLEESLSSDGFKDKLDDYRKFKQDVEPTLAAIPETFRAPMVAKFDELAAALKGRIAEILSVPAKIDSEPIAAEIAWCVDAPEGTPELLVVVLPVTDGVYTGWRDREDGVQTWMAARVVQALYEAAAESGFETAQANFGGHMGLLAVETDLLAAPSGFVEAFTNRLEALLSSAPELAGSKITLVARRTNVDFVLPPEDSEGGEEQTDA
jgi:hypothetical protein